MINFIIYCSHFGSSSYCQTFNKMASEYNVSPPPGLEIDEAERMCLVLEENENLKIQLELSQEIMQTWKICFRISEIETAQLLREIQVFEAEKKGMKIFTSLYEKRRIIEQMRSEDIEKSLLSESLDNSSFAIMELKKKLQELYYEKEKKKGKGKGKKT